MTKTKRLENLHESIKVVTQQKENHHVTLFN